jgi:hypothetical protein
MSEKIPQTANSGRDAAPPRSNTKFILAAIFVLLLLSGIQFFLLFTVADEKLTLLDPTAKISIEVVQVIDIDYPFFSVQEFQEILTALEGEIRDKLGYEVVFEQGRRIISDEYANPEELFTDAKAANAWFSSQLAVLKGWQTNFAWLTSIMQRPGARQILETYYTPQDPQEGSAALEQAIRQDFTQKISRLLEIRDLRGNRVFDDKEQEGLSSSAYWHYILGKQAEGDLVICNIPIFFPSALTPADAVTRGGLMTSMLTASARPLSGVVGLSSWPLLAAPHNASRENAQAIFVRIALQALARLLYRADYMLEPPGNLLYPMLGEDYFSWYTHSPGRLAENLPQPVKKF